MFKLTLINCQVCYANYDPSIEDTLPFGPGYRVVSSDLASVTLTPFSFEFRLCWANVIIIASSNFLEKQKLDHLQLLSL
jgi:hypothetical protein